MNVIRLLPVALSLLLLAAHFLRLGSMLLIVLTLMLPFLLFITHRWVARLMQTILVFGALEWTRTLLVLIDIRREAEEPWLRLAIILGSVAIFTALSSLVFCSRSLKKRYNLMREGAR